jgi:hypothetical protein
VLSLACGLSFVLGGCTPFPVFPPAPAYFLHLPSLFAGQASMHALRSSWAREIYQVRFWCPLYAPLFSPCVPCLHTSLHLVCNIVKKKFMFYSQKKPSLSTSCFRRKKLHVPYITSLPLLSSVCCGCPRHRHHQRCCCFLHCFAFHRFNTLRILTTEMTTARPPTPPLLYFDVDHGGQLQGVSPGCVPLLVAICERLPIPRDRVEPRNPPPRGQLDGQTSIFTEFKNDKGRLWESSRSSSGTPSLRWSRGSGIGRR